MSGWVKRRITLPLPGVWLEWPNALDDVTLVCSLVRRVRAEQQQGDRMGKSLPYIASTAFQFQGIVHQLFVALLMTLSCAWHMAMWTIYHFKMCFKRYTLCIPSFLVNDNSILVFVCFYVQYVNTAFKDAYSTFQNVLSKMKNFN